MNNIGKNIALLIVIGLLLVALFNMFQGPAGMTPQPSMPFSDFMADVGQGKVADVTIQGHVVHGHLTGNGAPFSTYLPDNASITGKLLAKNVKVTARPDDNGTSFWGTLLFSWGPMLLLVGVWIFFMRQMQAGGGRAMGFGRSRARMLTEKTGKVTFEDVAGVDEAKEELKEVVDFLKDPQKFQKLGGKIPKGVLLVGPPGTGKTLIARAVAGEANVPFFTISGSDFVEMFVGVGASRVRDMFEQGKKHAPCIIFIDEIDAVGRHRGAGLGGGNDEREQTLNQLLVEMDGFEANEGVILIAATNRPDVLDPALLRPGRFDRQVVVPNPDILGREKILKVHMRKVPLANDVDARTIARGTPGFSGADLANLVNEAALLAARANKSVVSMHELESAKDKVLMGAERRSMVMTDKEKELTAYHESGHALVSLNVPQSDPLHKITIIPRGRALGVTMNLPERDKYGHTLTELKSKLAMMFGGRVAEELIFGPENVTTGASSDIQQATATARRMVTEFGMSDKLGPVRYNANEQEIFLGHSVSQQQNVSEATAEIIDGEVRRLIEDAETRAREILTAHMDDLHTLSKALLEYETLTGEEVKALLRGEPLNRPEDGGAPPPKPAAIAGKRGSVPSSSGKPGDEGNGDLAPAPATRSITA
ncbi:MAG TPA: ATP-dependent zinc metalloprotease FtsH [Alphaproteobacteria bacterium]|nr:ATP-dependent zinc metalloprotease FtsH [Alphaproteobacteria bacterium]